MYLLSDILKESIPELRKQRLKPVTVAVIDSGIDSSHEVLKHCVTGAWEFVEENGEIISRELPPQSNNDDAGHGTAVASIICRLAPNVRILDYKVLNAKFAGSGKVMLKGFEAAIESDAKIINMSLACLSKYRSELEALCERAYQKHKIVIASKRNVPKENDLGFPAELSSCVSVENKTYQNPFTIEHIDEQPIEFAAHGENVLVARNGGGYYRLTGTSFATPTTSASVALLLGRYPELELYEIKSILKYHSTKKSYFQLQCNNPLETAEQNLPKGDMVAGYSCPCCGKFMRVHVAFSYVKCSECNHVYQLVSYIDKKLCSDVLHQLDFYISSKHHYHNRQHTQEVMANAHAFLQHYRSISQRDKKCLMTAALFHDYGYKEQYEDNEEIAARHAAEMLPSYGYTEKEIALIQSLIRATAMPVKPKTLLERILCDADVAHIGQSDYWEKSQLLRKERNAHGFKQTTRKWYDSEIAFLKSHHFFQKWLEAERKASRANAIERLQKAKEAGKKK